MLLFILVSNVSNLVVKYAISLVLLHVYRAIANTTLMQVVIV